jgi:hypothetical protein
MPPPPPQIAGATLGDIAELCRELRALGALEVHVGLSPDTSKLEVRFGGPHHPVVIHAPSDAIEAPPEDAKEDPDADMFDAVP